MKHFIGTICGLAILAPPVLAQPAVIRLTLGGGTATDLRGMRSGAYTVAPSATLFPHANLRLVIGARGTRFVTREWAIAGAAAADARLPVTGSTALVLGVSGDLTRASYRTTYLQAEAVPALEFRRGALTAWAGARGAAARTLIQNGSPVPLSGVPRESVVERSSAGPAFGAAISLFRAAPGEEMRLSYREEHGHVSGEVITDRIAAATLARGPVALTGTVGARRAPGENRVYGGVKAAIAVSQNLALFGGAETYPSNPWLGSSGGRSISAGVSLSTGGGKAVAAGSSGAHGPRPHGMPAPAPGLTRLSIRAGTAARVEVAGDWNHWQPVPLRRAARGVWYADLAIPPGEYRYAFRIDGAVWEVPKGVAAVNDGFGGRSAWLSVRKPERKS